MHNKNLTLNAAVLSLSLALPLAGRSEPVPVVLAEKGLARFPVVVSTGATARVLTVATNLAEQLARITGAPFSVRPGDGLTGLAVGVPADFPKLPVKPDFQPQLPTGREDYLLRTHSGGVYLLGATELAVEMVSRSSSKAERYTTSFVKRWLLSTTR